MEKLNAMQKRKIAGYRLNEAMKLANKSRNEILIALQRDYGMNVDKSMLSQYINGKKHIPDAIAIYISEILKIDPGYLMGTDNYSAAGNDYKSYISMTSTLDTMYKLQDKNKDLKFYFKKTNIKIKGIGLKDNKLSYVTLDNGDVVKEIPIKEIDKYTNKIDTYIQKESTKLMDKGSAR